MHYGGTVKALQGVEGQVQWVDRPTPACDVGQVRIRVAAAGLNRADLLQRAGNYPPPPGASDTLGLECSGIVSEVGAGCDDWQVGDRVCALLAGGGIAEEVVVDARHVLPVPEGLSLHEAAPDAELLPPITPYFVMKVGHVPRIAYQRPGAPEAAEAVAQAIARYGQRGTPIRAVMLERLGPNVWHDSPAAAMAVLEELEETARLYCMSLAGSRGAPAPLDEARIEELRRQFGAHW